MAWLSGWTYRKEITVTNASADYQTRVLVGESSGASGEEVDCGGNVAADFDDLRFTAADGTTLLDYWIESITGTTPNCLATVWVQNNATPDTTLYMYYDGTETAVSNGANTFIQFDDFEWGSNGDPLDDNGGSVTWTIANGDVDISTEQDIGDDTGFFGTRSMKLIGAAGTMPGASVVQAADTDYAIRIQGYKENGSWLRIYHGDGSERIYCYADASEDIYYYNGAAQDTGNNITADDWELIELTDINHGTPKYDIWLNGAKIQDDADMHTSANQGDVIVLAGYAEDGADTWIDNFIIRKWAATEPSFAFGSEEEFFTPRYGFVNFQDPAIV